MKPKKEKRFLFRRAATIGMVLLAFAAFGGALFYVQVVKGEEYAAVGSSETGRDVLLPAARGEIFDRNGVPLVVNRQSYSIIFEAADFPPRNDQPARNALIHNLIHLFETNSVPWIDDLPLLLDENGNVSFAPEREKDVQYLKSRDMLFLNDYATAQNCMDRLIEMFQLETYSITDAHKIASVCYSLRKTSFRISSPYTFAEDVPNALVAAVKEVSGSFPGVSTQIVPLREYMAEGWLAPHILGRIGAIDAEEYPALKEKSYQLNESVGKSGLEASMESYLRGTPGKKTVTTGSDGKSYTTVTEQPQQGNSLILSIDIEMQRIVAQSLEETLLNYYRTEKETPLVPPAGAAVVMNCKTGEVLAAASYPTYDITTYAENAGALANDPGAPLWDRTLMATYSPGSTIKPSGALAALEEGAIDKNTRFRCNGTFLFGGQRFKCDQHHKNRNVDVESALAESCNIFFYNAALAIEIDKLNEYRTLLGLGQKTGVELPEAAGRLDSPAYRQSIGEPWLPGYTVQAAIAQGSNSFTAMQMVNYCAAIANGGTRYVPHFVRTVKSYDLTKTVLDKTPEVAVEINIKPENLKLIHEGMWRAANQGAPRQYLTGLPVIAAAKTGTNQTYPTVNGKQTKVNNVFLITFAPYEDPELAVFVACDGFTSSSKSAAVAQKVYQYYFAQRGEAAVGQAENVLLG